MRFAVWSGQSCEIWVFVISTRNGIISNVWDRASISKALKFFFIQIFVSFFSTNRHVSRIGRLSWKFHKFSNFANSHFSVFIHESADSVIVGAILRRFEICILVKGGFFSYSSENLCVWRILKICKFDKLEFFFVFLNESVYLATFEVIFQISEIWVCSSRIRGQNWVWSSNKSNMARNLEKISEKWGISFYHNFSSSQKIIWTRY